MLLLGVINSCLEFRFLYTGVACDFQVSFATFLSFFGKKIPITFSAKNFPYFKFTGTFKASRDY